MKLTAFNERMTAMTKRYQITEIVRCFIIAVEHAIWDNVVNAHNPFLPFFSLTSAYLTAVAISLSGQTVLTLPIRPTSAMPGYSTFPIVVSRTSKRFALTFTRTILAICPFYRISTYNARHDFAGATRYERAFTRTVVTSARRSFTELFAAGTATSRCLSVACSICAFLRAKAKMIRCPILKFVVAIVACEYLGGFSAPQPFRTFTGTADADFVCGRKLFATQRAGQKVSHSASLSLYHKFMSADGVICRLFGFDALADTWDYTALARINQEGI